MSGEEAESTKLLYIQQLVVCLDKDQTIVIWIKKRLGVYVHEPVLKEETPPCALCTLLVLSAGDLYHRGEPTEQEGCHHAEALEGVGGGDGTAGGAAGRHARCLSDHRRQAVAKRTGAIREAWRAESSDPSRS